MRAASCADAPEVAALERELFGRDAWSEQVVTATLARGTVLVAHDDDALVGYVVLNGAGDVSDLERIAVRHDRQRAGVATALLDTALRAAASERVLLEVRADNFAALAFYARAGFVEIDRRRRYYRDGADAIVLELTAAQGR